MTMMQKSALAKRRARRQALIVPSLRPWNRRMTPRIVIPTRPSMAAQMKSARFGRGSAHLLVDIGHWDRVSIVTTLSIRFA